MKRNFALAAAVIAAFALTMQTADAGGRRHVDKRIKAVAIGAGIASTAAYFALNDWKWKWQDGRYFTQLGAYAATTMGCAAISPMVATVVVNRPLTMREGHVLVGSCVIPIVGGYLVNAAYNNNPQWEPSAAPVKMKKSKKKMK